MGVTKVRPRVKIAGARLDELVVNSVGLVDRVHMITRDMRSQAGREFGKVEGVQMARDYLGRRIEGGRFLVHRGVAGGACWHVQLNLVDGTTELDGDPGGSRLGRRHGRVATSWVQEGNRDDVGGR